MISAAPVRRPLSAVGSDELTAWLAARGTSVYRSRQLRAWLARGVSDFAQMTDLPAGLRQALAAEFRPSSLAVVTESVADTGLTTKVLYGLEGGYTVEAVLMRYPGRSTLCISSQVGCPVGCPFCATGQGPFGRNLRAYEITDQALDAARRLREEGRRLGNVVFMGMGEPMANYGAVLESIRQMAEPDILGLSPRRVTVSTSGLIPRIQKLAGERLPVTLAISLHAARDELRDVLVPVNRKWPLGELIPAAEDFARTTGRRVSYEWVLLAGVNDTERDAVEMGRLLRGRSAHVNLIPFNPVAGTPYLAPSTRAVREFAATARAQGLNVTVRDTRGREADAACGQLRARVLTQEALREAVPEPALSDNI